MRDFYKVEKVYKGKCYINTQKENRDIVCFSTRWCDILPDKEWVFNIADVDSELKNIYNELFKGININRILKIQKMTEHYREWVCDKGDNYFNIKFTHNKENKKVSIEFGFDDMQIINIQNDNLYFENTKYKYTHKNLKNIISNAIREMRYGGTVYEETKTI